MTSIMSGIEICTRDFSDDKEVTQFDFETHNIFNLATR